VGELQRIKIGQWTATPALNLLERESQSIRIEPRAMDVLVVLARHNGAVVSVENLIESVWKGVVVGDGSVYLAIRQLRQVLDSPPDGKSHIENIARRGYRLTVPVEDAKADSRQEGQAAPVPEGSRNGRKLRWWFAAAAAAAALLIMIALITRNDTPAVAAKSVAVLPFDNLSSDPEQEYFSDGVTEEILNTLSGVRDLRVIGRTSSFQLKGRTEDLRSIGKLLDVEHVLEGSVRKAGEQVRISAKLLNARTGEQLWAETYERRLDDVFAIQDEIARSVANALQIKLGVGEVARVPGMTRNVAAYDEYLRSVPLNLDGSYAAAIAHLQRAVALDPSFSAAWSGLSGVYGNGALRLPASQADEWRQREAEALERAHALTPDAPHVLLQVAIREVRRGNWLVAAPLYDGLEPAYAKYGMADKAFAPRGVFLSFVGRVRESIPKLERARADDPLAPALAAFLSRAYLARGDTAAALAEVDRGLGLQGSATRLQQLGFWIAMNNGDRPEMERRLQAVRVALDASRVNRVLELAKFLGAPAAAEAEIRRIAALDDPGDRVSLAVWAAYVRAPELSLQIMVKEAGNGEAIPALWMPLMRDVRKLPAFKELVRKAGLVDYWRAYGWSDYCRPVGDHDFTCG
jgi:TolB-like protein/DNA-binding winged helix-turn-helix (wHTH) protein